MNTYEERISLLNEMIAFAVVDGELHEREKQFLSIVATQLRIPKEVYLDLFHSEMDPVPIKSEFQRIQQFYRLALLMHVDGVLHEREQIAIQQIAINMGLNPAITKRILKMMHESETKIIAPDLILDAFREQHN
ncbi:MAG: TerB family tellurite resistance protein [Flavobacterium sp.]|nr:TerB family tellurite resistance protein [Flavobacterium sp.]